MTISLTRAQIDTALPEVAKGLEQYLWLQKNRGNGDLQWNLEFRRRFNRFYRVRRNKEWQDKFYGLLESGKEKVVSFPEVFAALHRATGRHEASFASKLLATLDPRMPVIDSIVLKNLGMRLPAAGSKDRAARICQLHLSLSSCFIGYLATQDGRYLVNRFREKYLCGDVTEVKMLDFVLWQTRENA
jgi:hypothetical protein